MTNGVRPCFSCPEIDVSRAEALFELWLVISRTSATLGTLSDSFEDLHGSDAVSSHNLQSLNEPIIPDTND
jgi:hypothetical protein